MEFVDAMLYLIFCLIFFSIDLEHAGVVVEVWCDVSSKGLSMSCQEIDCLG